jgi:hypothetical protein
MGWKDSGDAVVYPDGSLVKGPKARCVSCKAHFADLSTTSVPDTGGPVNIMTTHRSPEIG